MSRIVVSITLKRSTIGVGSVADSHQVGSLEAFVVMDVWPNQLAGVAAGRMPEFIEMMQAVENHKSGSARLVGR